MVNAPAPTDKSSTRILPSNPASSSPLLGEGNLDSSQEDIASRAIQRTRKPGVYTVPERRASVRKRPSNPSSTEGVTARQASSSLKEKANPPAAGPHGLPAVSASCPSKPLSIVPRFQDGPVALLHGEILSYKTILNVPLLHCGIRTLLEQAAQPKGEIVQKASFRT